MGKSWDFHESTVGSDIISYVCSAIPVWHLVQHIFAMRVESLLLGASFSMKL